MEGPERVLGACSGAKEAHREVPIEPIKFFLGSQGGREGGSGRNQGFREKGRRNAEGPAEGGEATPPGDGGTGYYLKTPSTRWVRRI